jgi:hypothetical protein
VPRGYQIGVRQLRQRGQRHVQFTQPSERIPAQLCVYDLRCQCELAHGDVRREQRWMDGACRRCHGEHVSRNRAVSDAVAVGAYAEIGGSPTIIDYGVVVYIIPTMIPQRLPGGRRRKSGFQEAGAAHGMRADFR